MPSNNTEAINLRITPELKAAVEKYGAERGLSFAASVRILLAIGLRAEARANR